MDFLKAGKYFLFFSFFLQPFGSLGGIYSRGAGKNPYNKTEEEKMKKRVVILLLAGCMTFGTLFTGCGSVETVKATVNAAKVDREADEEEANEEEIDEEEADKEDKAEKVDKKKKADDKESDTGEEKEEKEEKSEKKKKSSKSDSPVLGSADAEGYDGFRYLTEETLTSEETGDVVTVFIPEDEYASVNDNSAYSGKMGVEFDIRLDPYLQYEQEDYSAEENLEAFMEEEYDEFYTTDYKDLEISEVESIGSDAAVASAKYCEYQSWDDEYNVSCKTYYLKEVEPGTFALVKVSVNNMEATGKTQNLLDEVEAFYEFDVDWDADEAEAKLQSYLDQDDAADSDTFSTGFLKFELPKGWEKDADNSTYEISVYAPDGDTAFAECAVAVISQYVGSDIDHLGTILAEEDFAQEFLKEEFGDDVSDVSVESYGDTCIGDTVLIKCQYEQNGETVDCRFYMSGKGSYLYAVQAIQFPDSEEDAVSVAEQILETGKLNE